RRARLPLRAVQLRLAWVEGLLHAGRLGDARQASRHLTGSRPGALPPLLRIRVDRVTRSGAGSVRERPAPARAAAVPPAVEGIRWFQSLLRLAHSQRDEN